MRDQQVSTIEEEIKSDALALANLIYDINLDEKSNDNIDNGQNNANNSSGT